MEYADPRAPHALALRDYFRGDTAAVLTVHSDLGEHDELPVAVFFRGPAEYFPFERAALELCRGRVLDVGAGTGVHALHLQECGHDVVAIDVMAEAVEIMRARGVNDARRMDVMRMEGERFDTILMMMNGIGIFGTLERLKRFLRRAPRLLTDEGQILLDSGPARLVGDPGDGAEEVRLPEDGGYPGATWIRLEYRGVMGPPFRELYADPETLCDLAAATGWEPEIVFGAPDGGYVARLTGATTAAPATPPPSRDP